MDRIKGQLNVKLGARIIEQIKALAAQRGESQANVITIAIDRMAREENNMNSTRQNKISAVIDCIDALRRGVSDPTIILEGDRYEYIPGAWLTDISYTGSRTVVMQFHDAQGFGDFDLEAATDAEIQNAAEYAADEWDWEAIE